MPKATSCDLGDDPKDRYRMDDETVLEGVGGLTEISLPERRITKKHEGFGAVHCCPAAGFFILKA